MLDLPAFADVLGKWLKGKEGDWRPNVLKFSRNLVEDLQPRAVTRDLNWGVPIPLDEWRDNPNKRLYVWFDAVIGYLSAAIEWAERTGEPEAWRRWWQGEGAESFYFMGKDNIVFHSVIWPAILLGESGRGDRGGEPGAFGELNVPTEVVSSEFLTMEGQKFSSSRRVVIYVRDFLERYSADALRYFIMAAGPENQDTDFTWAEFVRRNNDELVAAWGNLVNRSVSMAAKNIGHIPEAGELTDEDERVLADSRAAFDAVGHHLERSQFKAALQEAMRTVSEANKYISDQAPWVLRKTDPERMATVLNVALQLVQDANTLLTPFLPESANKVYAMLGGTGTWTGMPRIDTGHDTIGGSEEAVDYPVITGDYADDVARWESTPIATGTPLGRPQPLFAKLDPSVVDEELARLGAETE